MFRPISGTPSSTADKTLALALDNKRAPQGLDPSALPDSSATETEY